MFLCPKNMFLFLGVWLVSNFDDQRRSNQVNNENFDGFRRVIHIYFRSNLRLSLSFTYFKPLCILYVSSIYRIAALNKKCLRRNSNDSVVGLRHEIRLKSNAVSCFVFFF